MNRKQHSGVFMMEMIMVVFFFILCASICILVFVRADRMSRQADDLNQGVLAAQSVAEVWKAESLTGLEKRFLAQMDEDGESLVMGFGKDGNTVAAEDAVYVVTLQQSEADENNMLQSATIVVSRDGGQVYTLSVNRHESAE